MSRKIAFFDFDGTVTQRDTLLQFIKYTKGNAAFLLGFTLNMPYLIAYKLGIISNQKAKEMVLHHFFKGTSVDTFKAMCNSFDAVVLPQLLRSKAIDEIRLLQQKGFEVVIVSASPKNWIKPWADGMHLQLIASELEVKDDMLTGRLKGNNCHGTEKVIRIQNQFSLDKYTEIIAYGDTKGDLPMLALARKKFYKPFRK